MGRLNMRALVIVDAWKKYDANHYFPLLHDEVHSFGVFLNQVCILERKKGTQIIHSYGENIPMEQIEIRPEDWILDNPKNLKKRIEKDNPNIDEIYFCGFHFGHCIPNHAKAGIGDDANIIINLSALLPDGKGWNHIMKRDSTFNYHLWSQNGIEDISIK
tara:strand:+ start:2650 stop:3129 length:480 start_codon:yes stop_codon:yes gene_type:complete